jgi:hypothetical protein
MDKSAVGLLNANADPVQHGFHLLAALTLRRKDGLESMEDAGDLTVEKAAPSNPNAKEGLIEFDHVLPRAKLYANWLTPSNDEATLELLRSTNFHPAQTVLLSTNTLLEQAPGNANADAGTVEITGYESKYVKLEADAKLPCVLLLNDKYAPAWGVSVDQKPATLLRCNFIMRGVLLPPGKHTVEFRYRPKLATLFVSLTGWAATLLVAGYLICVRKKQEVQTAPAPSPAPAPSAAPAAAPAPSPAPAAASAPAPPSPPKPSNKPPKQVKSSRKK